MADVDLGAGGGERHAVVVQRPAAGHPLDGRRDGAPGEAPALQPLADLLLGELADPSHRRPSR